MKNLAKCSLDEAVYDRFFVAFGDSVAKKLLNLKSLMAMCKKSLENYYCDGTSFELIQAWENSIGNNSSYV